MTLAVVTVSADELRALVRQEVTAAIIAASRQAADRVERISASTAARMLKRRPALVISACASGALPAQRTGKSWSIKVGDLDAWAAAGCSTAKTAP